MKAPLSWLKDFVPLPDGLTPAEIAQHFVNVGFEVEDVEISGSDITGPLLVGKVLAIEELTGHKKPIRYVTLDCGEGSMRSVICGARNFAVGDLVVVAIPGAVLPGDFSISSRETYGKISDGMICSAKELGMSDDHSGILVLRDDEATIGQDALELLQLKDVIFDISVNPDRGYALSIRGLAREIAGSLDLPFADPASLENLSPDCLDLMNSTKSGIVPVEIIDGASEIHLLSVEGVIIDSITPIQMRRRIEKCGMRSISLPVDITNYVMLELGQPLHAFDTDQIRGTINVRSAKDEERLVTLDGQTRVLSSEDLVIADHERALALAGTMGGADAEVGANTQRITIEAAHFEPLRIAKNSRRHRLSSEAARRFERFVDPALARVASARAVELLVKCCGAKYEGASREIHLSGKERDRSAKVDLRRLNQILGRDYSEGEMSAALRRIGASFVQGESSFVINVPSWRPDLEGDADFAEELARIHGYHLIPMKVPVGRPSSNVTGRHSADSTRRRRRLISDFLAARGFSETQNYPFTSQGLIDQLGFTGARARTFKIANPISDEFPVLRTHILQSLLPTVIRNMNRGVGNIALFEIGRIFRAPEEIQSSVVPRIGTRPSVEEIEALFDSVPAQPTMVAAVIAGEIERSGWWGAGRDGSWMDVISLAVEMVGLLGSKPEVIPSDFAPWHPGRCAEIRIGEVAVAHAGELHPRVIESLGLPARSSAFALILDSIKEGPIIEPEKVATMPPAIQDVALVVDEGMPAENVRRALIEGAGPLLEEVRLFDRYEKFAPGKVSLAFTLVLRALDRTLTSDEIAEIRNAAVARAAKETGAVLRG